MSILKDYLYAIILLLIYYTFALLDLTSFYAFFNVDSLNDFNYNYNIYLSHLDIPTTDYTMTIQDMIIQDNIMDISIATIDSNMIVNTHSKDKDLSDTNVRVTWRSFLDSLNYITFGYGEKFIEEAIGINIMFLLVRIATTVTCRYSWISLYPPDTKYGDLFYYSTWICWIFLGSPNYNGWNGYFNTGFLDLLALWALMIVYSLW